MHAYRGQPCDYPVCDRVANKTFCSAVVRKKGGFSTPLYAKTDHKHRKTCFKRGVLFRAGMRSRPTARTGTVRKKMQRPLLGVISSPICQDRLGTNVRKAHQKGCCIFLVCVHSFACDRVHSHAGMGRWDGYDLPRKGATARHSQQRWCGKRALFGPVYFNLKTINLPRQVWDT